MTTTPNMGLVLPVDGGSQNVWNVILDSVFATIDSHTHVAGQGIQIPPAGLNINADLTFGGNSAIGLKASVFSQVSASAANAYANALFVNSADANLYFRNAGGTNVQITSGNTINVSLVGGIGGDYASVGALLQYNDASRNYWLQQEGSPRPWAGLQTGDIQIFQKAASITQAVTVKSPNALAASYAWTLPAALPAAISTVRCDSSGNITTGPTTLTFRVSTTIADLNSNARVSTANGVSSITLTGGTGVAGKATFPLWLQTGDVITGFAMYVNKVTDATNTISVALEMWDSTSGHVSQDIVTLSTNAPGLTQMTKTGLNRSITLTGFATIWVGMTAGTGSTDTALDCQVTITRAT